MVQELRSRPLRCRSGGIHTLNLVLCASGTACAVLDFDDAPSKGSYGESYASLRASELLNRISPRRSMPVSVLAASAFQRHSHRGTAYILESIGLRSVSMSDHTKYTSTEAVYTEERAASVAMCRLDIASPPFEKLLGEWWMRCKGTLRAPSEGVVPGFPLFQNLAPTTYVLLRRVSGCNPLQGSILCFYKSGSQAQLPSPPALSSSFCASFVM